jgi:hypothetical protein
MRNSSPTASDNGSDAVDRNPPCSNHEEFQLFTDEEEPLLHAL